jgi:galactokinase
MAAAALARRLTSANCVIERLGDFSRKAGLSDADIDSLLEGTFKKETCSLDEVAELLGAGAQFVHRAFLGAFSDEEVRSLPGFKLRRRCRHVFSEGRRVQRAVDALRAGDMSEFGALMCQSHRSCSADFEVSCPELDALTEIAMESGALGSRLTGAGFGGCAISLVADEEAAAFIESVERRYYAHYLGRGGLSPQRSPEHMFVCRSSSGAGTFPI